MKAYFLFTCQLLPCLRIVKIYTYIHISDKKLCMQSLGFAKKYLSIICIIFDNDCLFCDEGSNEKHLTLNVVYIVTVALNTDTNNKT